MNKLQKLIENVAECTSKLQMSEKTFKRYKLHYEFIAQYCMDKKMCKFSEKDACELCMAQCPGMKKEAAREFRKAAYTVARYYETGKFSWKMVTVTHYPVSDSYNNVLQNFNREMSKSLAEGTVRVGITIIRQFLFYLEKNGINSLSEITTDDVLGFVRQDAPNHKASMDKFLRTLRKFLLFLRKSGMTNVDADRFLMSSGKYRRKALPCFSESEIKAIFSEIDRMSDKGRRDYAIFITALRTGLRASDIAGLRLADIDWNNGTICIIQKKTGTSIDLPLPIDVGNAIADYILKTRVESSNPYVFQRLRKPSLPTPIEPTAFNGYLRKYMEAAGLDRTRWDGKTFHALRRTAGTNMITTGAPVSTVAQVLGHRSIESSKRYITFDTENLRQCCMKLGALRTRKEGLY